MSIQVTAEGRLTAQPEVRFSQAGKAWVTGTVASNERRLNKQTNEWEDGSTTFLRFKMFGRTAEAVGQLAKGELVIVTGRLEQSDYEDKQGQRRTSYDVIAASVATVVRNQVSSAAPAAHGGAGAASWGTSVPNASSGAPGASQGDPWAQPFEQESPF